MNKRLNMTRKMAKVFAKAKGFWKATFPLALAVVIACQAWIALADTETVDGITWTYTVSDGKASLGGGWLFSTAVPKSTIGAITIPSTLGGYPITSIGNYAFYGCSGLTLITIPNSVTSIAQQAFDGCSSLTSLIIPNSVTSIGDSAFNACSSLTSLTIPNSVTSIGNWTFSNGLNELFDDTTIPGVYLVDGWVVNSKDSLSGDLDLTGCRGIGNLAFRGCSSLTSVTIGYDVKSIGDMAFEGCSGLKLVKISGSVTSIGLQAFYGCSGLTSVTIGNGVKSIGNNAFRDCEGLTSVTIPDSVTSIGDSAFSGCSDLKSVTIPDSVTSIGGYAFDGCSNELYDDTTIPGVYLVDGWVVSSKDSLSGNLDLTGYRGIGDYAFFGCSGLNSVTIPSSVTSIGEYTFYGCRGLTSVTIPDSVTSIEFCAFVNCSGLTSVTIPDSVTSIGDFAFYWCSSLTSVTIPDSVTSIGESAFSECSGLKSVAIPNSVTSIGSGVFNNCVGLDSLILPLRFKGKVSGMGIRSGCVVSYHGFCNLTVSSAYGQPVPQVGNETFEVLNSTNLSCHVNGIHETDSLCVRYVCTGWSGTGSVPASGTGTNVTFDIKEDSSLTWLWRKENAIKVSVTVGGSCGFGEQWVAEGAAATATIVPDTHLFSISLSGDTDGVVVSGATLQIPSDKPRDIVVTVEEEKLSLDVVTGHGVASPTGRTEWSWGDMVATSVIADEPMDGIRYVCTGWQGTGSVPGNGTWTNVSFQIKKDSTLTWNWQKQNLISVSASGAGSCAFGTQWVNGGKTVSATLVPDSALFFAMLSGDADSVALEGTTLRIPSDKPRDIGVTIIPSDVIEGDGESLSWGACVGGHGWSIVADTSAADGYVLRSDEIESGETAAIEATVDGPGRLDFDWRISANRGDYARIYVDGVQMAQITRRATWAAASIAIDGDSGPHTVRWTYEHMASATANDNAAYLDNVSWHPMTLAEALDGEGLVWTTDEGAKWTAQNAMTGDGEDAAVSGPVDVDGISGLETTISGPGTLAWRWKLAVEDVSGLDVIVDGDFGNPARAYEESGDWAEDSLAFDDDGTHTIRFEFWNLGSVESDCAYLDCVSWTLTSTTEPIPPLATNAAPETVTNAIANAGLAPSVAETLQDAIGGDAAKYNEFKTWAQTVKDGNGKSAGEAAVVASERAAISYLLGTDTLIAKDIVSDDVHIIEFSIDHGAESSGGEMRFSFEVAIDGVEIGSSGTIALASLKENLKKAIGIEGATRLDGEFSSANIELTFDAPVDGKARFTATPPPDAADSFFMRVKMEP